MQVLGLTSYSHWPEAAALRACARTSVSARERLQAVARARLESMVHVGIMEELDLSIASLAVCASPAPSSLRHLAHKCSCPP